MTEEQWLTCGDPEEMLATFQLQRHVRKMRLFLVAHCRRAWGWLGERGQPGVLVAERFADGHATDKELEAVHVEAGYAVEDGGYWLDALYADEYPEEVVHEGGVTYYESRLDPEEWRVAQLRYAAALFASYATTSDASLWGLFDYLEPCSDGRFGVLDYHHAPAEAGPDADNVRCIFGNPFRPCSVGPRCLTAKVLAVAQEMYESGDFTPAGVLADALEDAGCDDAQILAHLRGPAPHVPGCHVVDLLLGKA